MKNNKSYFSGVKNIRLDAMALAILLFVQSVAPAMAMNYSEISLIPEMKKLSSPQASDRVYDKIDLNKNELSAVSEIPETESASQVIANRMPGGPDQPEVQSFTPIGTDGMVDPFSGDFSYNVPLMDVDGYPLNIAYNAGVGMDQEASWVGLGWNLNPGVINRNMRGIPDDFNGTDEVLQEYNQKPNWSVGVNVGANYEVFAIDLTKEDKVDDTNGLFSVSASLGVQYNNYNGYSADFSFGPSFNIAKKLGFEVGLEFTGSSQGGATIGANMGLTTGNQKGDKVQNKLSIGSSFNSRQGLQQLSINLSQQRLISTDKKHLKTRKIGMGNQLGGSFNFGMPTYVAQIPFETRANSFTARFKLGFDVTGNDYSLMFSGFFSKSSLVNNSKSVPAYGYTYLQFGQLNTGAMLDFNRENNAAFTKNTPALPIPLLTYDIFSVSGQGISGSYRLDRADIGYVFDPYISTSSNSYTAGGEAGIGATFKAGVDVGAVFSSGSAGLWKDGNSAANAIGFYKPNTYFRDANELSYDESDAAFENIGAAYPVAFSLTNHKKLSTSLRGYPNGSPTLSNAKSLYFRRNQPLTSLTVKEVKNGYGITKLPTNAYAANQTGIDHHIGALTVTKTDGARYYYGLPAYSKFQKNVSFAVGYGNSSGLFPSNWDSRLVAYSNADASVNNDRGLDNHFNAQTIPAYVHSYMLTAVLNADYVDSDNTPGPSKNDLGSYIEFKYKQVENYKWRNPVNQSLAFYDKGLNADPTDEKANYIYGEKELWYLDTMKTKNHIVIFYTSGRQDAVSVNGESGGIATINAKMQKLDSIKMFSLPEFEALGTAAVPVQTVHLVYDYSLCRNYAANLEAGSSDTLKGGKLTLRKIYFTYQDSYKGERTPYEFYYGYNPDYNPNNVDRWGTYKPNPTGLTGNEKTDPLTNADYPYVGYDKASTDLWASAWNLSTIKLPSGGSIKVFYESDDYAYVQHKRAKQMFKIVNVGGSCEDNSCQISYTDGYDENRKFYFEMIPGTSIYDYGSAGDEIYFKVLLSMDKDQDHYDYVPGYAKINSIGTENGYGYITLQSGTLKDNGPSEYNPMTISGIQFARNYLSRIIPPSNQLNPQTENGGFLSVAQAIAGAFTSYGELFTGPNKALWDRDIAKFLILNKSWIRLYNPDYAKLGGGHRVKEIRTYDAWDDMVNGQESYYGQQYEYFFDGKSSGVASYEPQLGGEENTWRQYVANNIRMTWAPDERNYMETPFGEQFFPSPSVGYAKVLIKNIEREGVVRTATGHTTNEFYTARDFPTLAYRTSVKTEQSKYNLNLLLYSKTQDMMAASQGFVVENNDMHGKPKSVNIYAEGQKDPYSSVNYYYQSSAKTIDGVAANVLENDVKVIQSSGSVKTVVVGRTYEAVADFRENKSKMNSGNIGINLNYTMPFIFVPMILGANYSNSKTEFRSAVLAKTIERKGILYKTVAKDYNSEVETENLAYDAETGEVLLTSVNNSFRDTVYNFTYPAHWIYDGMGQAYKNLGYTSTVSNVFTDGYSTGLSNSNLIEGDEVMLVMSGNYIRGWVTESGVQGVRILEKDGTPVDGTVTYLKVIRSGNRNLQSTPVGSVALKKNPLNTLTGNVLDEVISAQSIEYGQSWKTFCDCENIYNPNPYVSGLKGNWNPKTTYLHLSGRTQAYENENTDIRQDGVMESFNPFFRLENGNWKINKENWTYTSEVSEFSPFGQPLETVDALNRYSATQIGYNQTLQVAVVANSERKESGFDGFEDYQFESCPDGHFKVGTTANVTDSVSHTGRYSITVNAGHPVVLEKQINEVCNDENLCDFSTYIIDSSPSQIYVMETEGISMTYEVVFGDPNPVITEVAGGYLLTFNSTGQFRVEVRLTRSDGCTSVIPVFN